jgi:hypothetical protein
MFTVASGQPKVELISERNFMKRLLAVTLFVLGMAHSTLAQDQKQISEESNRNVAADFAQTSAASAPAVWLGNAPLENTRRVFGAPEGQSFAGLSLSSSAAGPASFGVPASPFAPLAAPAGSSSPAAPPPQGIPDPYGAEKLEYRMEISAGFSLVRFRSSIYSATAPGFSATFAYYLFEKLAIEGSFTTGFAPTIFANEHVKYVGYGAGPKYVLWHARLEPWVHAIIGGGHIQPNTALGHKNAFDVQAGLGADYLLFPRVAARIGVDWVRTNFVGESQNSGQATAALVIHF